MSKDEHDLDEHDSDGAPHAHFGAGIIPTSIPSWVNQPVKYIGRARPVIAPPQGPPPVPPVRHIGRVAVPTSTSIESPYARTGGRAVIGPDVAVPLNVAAMAYPRAGGHTPVKSDAAVLLDVEPTTHLAMVPTPPAAMPGPYAPAYVDVGPTGQPVAVYPEEKAKGRPAEGPSRFVDVGPQGGGGGGGGGGGTPSGGGGPGPESYDDSAPWAPPRGNGRSDALVTGGGTVTPTTSLSATQGTAIVTLSWWRRFLNWLGFGEKKTVAAATAHGERGTLDQEVGSLVRRARAGDQNAMGIIELIGKGAKDPANPKARAAGVALMAYIKAHPVDASASMGDEPRDPTFCEAVKLARGPTLFDNRIRDFAASQFGADTTLSNRLFAHGVRSPHLAAPQGLSDNLVRAHRMGRTVGLARKLQAVRSPAIPLSCYDVRIGHELGEEPGFNHGAELDRISMKG